MIIVLSSVQIQEGKIAEALRVTQEHVLRSRLEAGCLEYGVSVDAENPNRLVFTERWESMEALKAHFEVPASRDYVKAVGAVASAPAAVSLFQVSKVKP